MTEVDRSLTCDSGELAARAGAAADEIRARSALPVAEVGAGNAPCIEALQLLSTCHL